MQKCERCSFETGSIIGLARHVKQKHGITLGTKKNTCMYCKRVFSSSTSCSRHMLNKICIKDTPITEEIKEVKEEIPIKTDETLVIENEQVKAEVNESFIKEDLEIDQIYPKESPRIISTIAKMALYSVMLVPLIITVKKLRISW